MKTTRFDAVAFLHGLYDVGHTEAPAPFPRRLAAEMLRYARCGGDAVWLRDAWRERIAIATIDGGLALEDAERLAADELRRLAEDN